MCTPSVLQDLDLFYNLIAWVIVAHPERSIMSAWECDQELYYCEQLQSPDIRQTCRNGY